MSPVWVPSNAVVAIHQALLQEHGGLMGPPSPDSLEAALARPQQLHQYTDPKPSLPRLAAAYGFAIAKGHCFSDGNKRLALAIIDVFLQLNALELVASEPDSVVTMQSLAAGKISEEDLAVWIADNAQPLAQ
jgi:death-on-curing protein